MSRPALFAADLVAVTVLVFGLYFPRHRRRDLVGAFLGVNVAVLAVADALSETATNAGLGLGLFGVLSIIRLRSSELDQDDIAYYFASLGIGLLGGLSIASEWLTPVLMAAIVVALFIGDHPRLFAGYRMQAMTLDRAFTDELALRLHLEQRLGAEVMQVKVRRVDLVDDTTNLEVRYRLRGDRPVPTVEVDQRWVP